MIDAAVVCFCLLEYIMAAPIVMGRFRALVPSRLLRTFWRLCRRAVWYGYPSSSVTSRCDRKLILALHDILEPVTGRAAALNHSQPACISSLSTKNDSPFVTGTSRLRLRKKCALGRTIWQGLAPGHGARPNNRICYRCGIVLVTCAFLSFAWCLLAKRDELKSVISWDLQGL